MCDQGDPSSPSQDQMSKVWSGLQTLFQPVIPFAPTLWSSDLPELIIPCDDLLHDRFSFGCKKVLESVQTDFSCDHLLHVMRWVGEAHISLPLSLSHSIVPI